MWAIYCIQSNLYKAHNSCPLYTGYNYMHYSLRGNMRPPFIDSDLLYRDAL